MHSSFIMFKQNIFQADDFQTQSYYSLMPVQFGRTFDNVISLSQCSFNWGLKSFQLNNINFSVAKGSFVGITGQVGSGKSTLLHAILAEIYKNEGVIASSNMRDGKIKSNIINWPNRSSLV